MTDNSTVRTDTSPTVTETASAEATASHNSPCGDALVVTDVNPLVTAIADATAAKVHDGKFLRVGFDCPEDDAASHEAALTRLSEDLKLADRSSKTITNYTRTVRGFLSRCNKNVRDLTVNDLRDTCCFCTTRTTPTEQSAVPAQH